MPLFRRDKPSVEVLEETRDRLIVENEVESLSASVAEKKAIVKELRKQYGKNWRATLGLKGMLNISDLRNALGGMKKGLVGDRDALYNPKLSPLPKRRPDADQYRYPHS